MNVAILDTDGKSRMFLRNSLAYLGNTVRSFADVFYFSDYASRDDVKFDALVYNIADSLNRDNYKSIILLFELFSIPIIIVSRKKDIRLLRALNNMGIENYVLNDSDIKVKLSVALDRLDVKRRLKTNKRKKVRFRLMLSSYILSTIMVFAVLVGFRLHGMEKAQDDNVLYFRGDIVPMRIEIVRDTVDVIND